MEHYWPDEFVLIGCRYTTDSMQPEKNSFLPGIYLYEEYRFFSLLIRRTICARRDVGNQSVSTYRAANSTGIPFRSFQCD